MRTALYRAFDADGLLLYIGISARPIQRIYEHKCRAGWASSFASVTHEWFDQREDAAAAEAEAINREQPAFNERHRRRGELSFGPVDPGMPLREWLKLHDITQFAFARHINIDPGVVSRFIAGLALPSVETAVLIESATHGAVRPAIWVRASRQEAAA